MGWAARVKPRRSIYLGTPMYGGTCSAHYVQSLIELVYLCERQRIPLSIDFLINESLITRARNVIVDRFLQSDCSHLMFVDADIEFQAKDVLTLLELDAPILAGPYAKKDLNWASVRDAAKLGLADQDAARLADYSGSFVFNTEDTPEVRADGLLRVRECGTGFMLIRREVFETLKQALPNLAYRSDGREMYAFFDTEIADGQYLSEDWTFCRRAQTVGFEILVCPWIHLHHVGTLSYSARLTDR